MVADNRLAAAPYERRARILALYEVYRRIRRVFTEGVLEYPILHLGALALKRGDRRIVRTDVRPRMFECHPCRRRRGLRSR